jgi:hypothetical protein
MTGQDQARRGALSERLNRVRRCHYLVPWQTVCDDAAEQQESDQGD